MRHFIEQVVGIVHVSNFAVHVDEMVGNEEIKRVCGVVGKHVIV